MATPHFPTDYDQYAPTYAWARSAVEWVLAPLVRECARPASGAMVLEIGCGTANYLIALASRRSDIVWVGFDLSGPMLRQARARGGSASFALANASRAFPCRSGSCELAFAVDVIHHISDPGRFFSECSRVLASGGRLLLVTDSDETMRERSLTRFFPELLSVETLRYPPIESLHEHAAAAGLRFLRAERADGYVELSDDFIQRLAAKCSSAMRLISDEEHAAGMARVRDGQARGERWRSCYVVLHYGAP